MHRRPGPTAGAAEKYNAGASGAVQHLDRSCLRGVRPFSGDGISGPEATAFPKTGFR